MSMSEIVYRDYGELSGMTTLQYDLEVVREPSLVFDATHDKAGIRLSYRDRSFISFSFGGKWIEDFGVISVTGGDRLSRSLSGEFEDLTSLYDVLDGLIYHSTHFKNLTFSFILATDGMDLRQLEDFKHWFSGGKIRPLILSEHPNRKIMARVALPPEMSMLPFEKEIELKVGSYTYKTSTTVYKGEINIEFIADDPFWESIINIFGTVSNNGAYVTEWDGLNFFDTSAAAQDKLKDVLKIVYEDGIPIYNMIDSPMLFGNDIFASAGERIISRIVTSCEEGAYNAAITALTEGYYNNGLKDNESDNIYFYLGEDVETHEPIYSLYYFGAVIEDENNITYRLGVIDGAYISSTENNSLDLAVGSLHYLYYAGTAPAPITLSFTIPINLNGNGYISSISNNYVKRHTAEGDDVNYNTIILEGTLKHELRLTTPNFLTSYNNVMSIFNNMTIGQEWETIRAIIRDEIRHPIIRKYAIKLINGCSINSSTITSVLKTGIINYFLYLFHIENGAPTTTFSLVMNSKTGESTGTFEYYDLSLDDNNNFVTTGLLKLTLTENVGDMLSSNYLILDEKNYFSDNMQIVAWQNTEKGRTYSYRIYHTFPQALNNLLVLYKNLYY